MKCPYCSCQEDKAIDSRPTDEGATIRRRRECLNCRKRFTTYEKVEHLPIIVIKKDGSREPYDRDKVRKGILRATEKRSVSADEIERMLDSIESHIYNSLEREVTSEFIGELVMEKLRDLDEVAYVRFTKVYRKYKDINTYMHEHKKLHKNK